MPSIRHEQLGTADRSSRGSKYAKCRDLSWYVYYFPTFHHFSVAILILERHQGADRTSLLAALKTGHYDVLLVSYHTLSAEYKSKFGKKGEVQASKRTKRESILDVPFHRIVLDEAHIVRSSKTTLFKAVAAVQATRKWALTGTPFVNRADDIHSLLQFVGVEPLANKDIFRRAVTVPIQTGDDLGLTRLRVVMSHIALRRSKATVNVTLPDKDVQLARVSFEDGSPHKAVYDALFGCMRMAFQAVLQDGEGAALKRYTSVFESLLRMRQSCCSALLVPKSRRESAMELWRDLQGRAGAKGLSVDEGVALLEKLKGSFSQSEENDLPECAVCLTEMEESQCMILRTCSHLFCEPCISRVQTSHGSVCPLCRQAFGQNDLVNKSTAASAASQECPATISVDEESIGDSPKILALLDCIKKMKPDEKGVVFSQL
jgi:SNF2 family DNA or RNA helicase